MIKLNVFLVRHGEKNKEGSAKTPLTPRGKKQAGLLAKRLGGMTKRKKGTKEVMEKIIIDKIISSDLPRCIETTKIINRLLKKPVIYEPALREISPKANSSTRTNYKEKKTIGRFYKKLIKEKGNILVVSSGNVNKNIISRVWGISPKKVWMGHYATGLNHFTVDEKERTNIICLNDSGHLTDKLKLSKHIIKGGESIKQ